MAIDNGKNGTLTSKDSLLLPNRQCDRTVALDAKLPGVVIFLHGVNDPGATYETVEKGLCQGLNERLDREDLAPGRYGAEYQAVRAQWEAQRGQSDRTQSHILGNPDANLYQRTEAKGQTHSPFIPFYWGYRACEDEIAKDPETSKPLTMRGQYQDVNGNRLDQQFAKEGGFFSNATNNIPDMYGTRFKAPASGEFATRHNLGGNYVYIADAPLRHYFVLAAHRLAMLVRTIRNVQAMGDKVPKNDTITIMGHSQGSIIALLAQAILHQEGQRCADCLIMVDSPYSVHEETPPNGDEDLRVQTSQAKIQTLINIVNAVTHEPHAIPELADLMICASQHHGRTGERWQKDQGQRPGMDGKQWVTFVERDNRGKVYCYFCPEDTVVALSNIHGIGTFGVPDKVEVKWLENTGRMVKYYNNVNVPVIDSKAELVAVMDTLQNMRFYQRMWTRLKRQENGLADNQAVKVGLEPGRIKVRKDGQRRSAGPDSKPADIVVGYATQDRHEIDAQRLINGEKLSPPYAPDMYGGEVVTGGQRSGDVDKAGLMAPDDVAVDVALGNRYASFKWFSIGAVSKSNDCAKLKAEFNAGKQLQDQTQTVRALPLEGSTTVIGMSFRFEREETPNEARLRMADDPDAWSENNYHSGILNSSENQRWVTAMDVAIGQAVVLDDPDWRNLLMLMADWRYTDQKFDVLSSNPCYSRLDDEAKKLLVATRRYFLEGKFPDENILPKTPPALVVSQTVSKRFARQLAVGQGETPGSPGVEGSW